MAMAALVSRKVKIAKRKRYTRTLAQPSTRRAPSHFFLFVSCLFHSSFFLSFFFQIKTKHFFISVDS